MHVHVTRAGDPCMLHVHVHVPPQIIFAKALFGSIRAGGSVLRGAGRLGGAALLGTLDAISEISLDAKDDSRR